jgi:carbonic anhydrase/acetyltransferase-like protein (isoleucine patch superfamily)
MRLGTHSSVWHNAVLRGDSEPISIGPRSNVQDGAVIHVDAGSPCLIGAGVTIGHGAVVHGALVEDDVLIGIGAIVLNGARIGHDCIIGAGTLVTGRSVIPPRSMVLGLPGRVVRSLTDEEVQSIRTAAEHYVKYGADYKHGK